MCDGGGEAPPCPAADLILAHVGVSTLGRGSVGNPGWKQARVHKRKTEVPAESLHLAHVTLQLIHLTVQPWLDMSGLLEQGWQETLTQRQNKEATVPAASPRPLSG